MGIIDSVITKVARTMYTVAGSLAQKNTNGYVSAATASI